MPMSYVKRLIRILDLKLRIWVIQHVGIVIHLMGCYDEKCKSVRYYYKQYGWLIENYRLRARFRMGKIKCLSLRPVSQAYTLKIGFWYDEANMNIYLTELSCLGHILKHNYSRYISVYYKQMQLFMLEVELSSFLQWSQLIAFIHLI